MPTGPENFEPSDDDDSGNSVIEGMQKLTIEAPAFRYHGKSSGLTFIRSALEMKMKNVPQSAGKSESVFRHTLVCLTLVFAERAQLLRGPQWPDFSATEDDLPVFSDFPPTELLDYLVDLYFRNVNDHFQLLHEPSFKASISNGLHRSHGGLGATVLLVCANGSRYAPDPAALLDDSYPPSRSSGWQWYQAVKNVWKLPLAPAKLHDLQVYAVRDTTIH